MNPSELLSATAPYLPPARMLEDLSTEEAERCVTGAPHSIAQIVAHMAFWQDWFAGRARSTGGAMPAHAAQGWPQAEAGTWAEIRAGFLAGLEQWNDLAATETRVLAPPLDPPLAHYSGSDALVHVALHNAHHLGQVVLLRQLIGRWPPPSGGWTW